ncbi:hypothetical protein QUA83_17375 [Microcoleus sp. K1-B1]
MTNFDIFFARLWLQLSPFYYYPKLAQWFPCFGDRLSCWNRLY